MSTTQIVYGTTLILEVIDCDYDNMNTGDLTNNDIMFVDLRRYKNDPYIKAMYTERISLATEFDALGMKVWCFSRERIDAVSDIAVDIKSFDAIQHEWCEHIEYKCNNWVDVPTEYELFKPEQMIVSAINASAIVDSVIHDGKMIIVTVKLG